MTGMQVSANFSTFVTKLPSVMRALPEWQSMSETVSSKVWCLVRGIELTFHSRTRASSWIRCRLQCGVLWGPKRRPEGQSRNIESSSRGERVSSGLTYTHPTTFETEIAAARRTELLDKPTWHFLQTLYAKPSPIILGERSHQLLPRRSVPAAVRLRLRCESVSNNRSRTWEQLANCESGRAKHGHRAPRKSLSVYGPSRPFQTLASLAVSPARSSSLSS